MAVLTVVEWCHNESRPRNISLHHPKTQPQRVTSENERERRERSPFPLAHDVPARSRSLIHEGFVVLDRGGQSRKLCTNCSSPLMKTKPQILVAISYLAISTGAAGQTQLKFWLPSSVSAHERAAYQKAADAFSHKNPSIKV